VESYGCPSSPPHPHWGDGRDGSYSTDYHPPSGTDKDVWAFKIYTSEALGELVLSWQGPQDILERSHLVDDDLGVTVTPVKNSKSVYEYVTDWNGTNQRYFHWVLKKPKGKKGKSVK